MSEDRYINVSVKRITVEKYQFKVDPDHDVFDSYLQKALDIDGETPFDTTETVCVESNGPFFLDNY